MRHKSHLKWSWIFMVLFFVLSIVDIRFGLLGFICMGAPIYHAAKGKGKIHCAKYCPRGSFFQKFLSQISLRNNLPAKIKTDTFRYALIILMLTLMFVSLYQAGMDIKKISFTIFRFMLVSTIVGIFMGIIYKPRSWCTICPMGTITGKIKKKE